MPEPVEPRESTNVFNDSDEDYPTENNLNQTDFSHTKPIVIESDYTKYGKFHEVDSANHSFDDGVDVVDGIAKAKSANVNSETENSDTKKLHANSVDSGISNNVNSGVSKNVTQQVNGEPDIKVKSLPSRLSDLSLKESEHSSNRDTSSDDDKFESDQDVPPRIKTNGMVTEKKNGVSLNLKLQSEMRYAINFIHTDFSPNGGYPHISFEDILIEGSERQIPIIFINSQISILIYHPEDMVFLNTLTSGSNSKLMVMMR